MAIITHIRRIYSRTHSLKPYSVTKKKKKVQEEYDRHTVESTATARVIILTRTAHSCYGPIRTRVYLERESITRVYIYLRGSLETYYTDLT